MKWQRFSLLLALLLGTCLNAALALTISETNETGTSGKSSGTPIPPRVERAAPHGKANLDGYKLKSFYVEEAPASCPTFSGGSGTAGDPYLIATLADLEALASSPACWALHFAQTADINATGSSFAGIGNATTSFTGSYNGRSFAITNLGLNIAGSVVGMFRYVGSGAIIKNLRLDNASITGLDTTGAFVGYCDEAILDSLVLNPTSTVIGNNRVGGIVGQARNSSINRCMSMGAVTGLDRVGGIAGFTWKFQNPPLRHIDSCSVLGTVTGNTNVGGLAGYCYFSITHSSVGGVISNAGASPGDIGGLVGELDTGTFIQFSYFYGEINAPQTDNVGGLVGFNQGSISNCYVNSKNITALSDAGGIAGYLHASGSIKDCFTIGNITGTDDIGGLVGHRDDGDVLTSYAAMKVVNVSDDESAGLLAENDSGTEDKLYWIDLVHDDNAKYPDEENKILAQLYTVSDYERPFVDHPVSALQGSNAVTTLAGFNFSDTWQAATPGVPGGFPILRNMPAPSGSPIPPIAFNATGGNAQVTLSWKANPEPAVTYYKIVRRNHSGTVMHTLNTVSQASGTITLVDDGTKGAPAPVNDSLYHYSIRAYTATDSSFTIHTASAEPGPYIAGLEFSVVTTANDTLTHRFGNAGRQVLAAYSAAAGGNIYNTKLDNSNDYVIADGCGNDHGLFHGTISAPVTLIISTYGLQPRQPWYFFYDDASVAGYPVRNTTGGAGTGTTLVTGIGNDTVTVSTALDPDYTDYLFYVDRLPSATNSAPVFNNLNDITARLAKVKPGAAAWLSDPDLDSLNAGAGNFNGTTLSIQRSGGANAIDQFILSPFSAKLSFTADSITYGGKQLGTYTNAAGALSIQFSATEVIPNAALLDTIVSSIMYTNTSNLSSQVVLEWTFSDGNLPTVKNQTITPAYYSGGSGTSADPWLISNLLDLKDLSQNTFHFADSFKQTANINAGLTRYFDDQDDDLDGDRYNDPADSTAVGGNQGFGMIGIRLNPFTGVYDGQGHDVDSVHISRATTVPNDSIGFFGQGLNAKVMNLGLTNANVKGDDATGGLMGAAGDVELTDCHVSGAVRGENHVGGLCGRVDFVATAKTILRCHSEGTVNGSDDNNGGLIGRCTQSLEECYSTASVVNASNGEAGGLVGLVLAPAGISKCWASGSVSSTSSSAGGLIGEAENGNITDCYATGNVSGVGNVGGLVGLYDENAVGATAFYITDCYAWGNATGTGNDVGGLVGESQLSVRTSYSKGAVSTTGTVVGGLVGNKAASATVTNSFWDTQTSGRSTSSGGTGKTTAEMKSICTYLPAGWDFKDETANGSTDNWTHIKSSNNGYPALAIQNLANNVQRAYVTQTGSGSMDGSNWANALAGTQIQTALNDPCIKEIWVAAGTYHPTNTVGGATDRHKAFQLKNGVALYGGFAGNEGQDFDLSLRDFSNETILSGDLGTAADESDNSFHVIHHPSGSNLDSTAIIDGFVISFGNANGSGSETNGGGMLNDGNSPKVRNCVFSYNKAAVAGGGVDNKNSSAKFEDCSFFFNEATNGGGGVTNESGGSPSFSNCTFDGNSAITGNGGAVYNLTVSPEFNNCSFANNTASGRGGAIFNFTGSNPVYRGGSIYGNSAPNGGGVVHQGSGTSKYIGVTFHSNLAIEGSAGSGGAVFVDGSCTSELVNCLLYFNSSTSYGGAAYLHTGGTLKVVSTTLSKNSSNSGGGIYSNSGSNLDLYNSIAWENLASYWGHEIFEVDPNGFNAYNSCFANGFYDIWESAVETNCVHTNPRFRDAANDDFTLFGASPCVNTGDSSYVNAPNTVVTTDLRGEDRVMQGNTDMGCYEYTALLDPFSLRYFVNDDASGANDGASWTNAFTSLQSALEAALHGDSIFVAGGTYYPASYNGLDPGTPANERLQHFRLPSGVRLIGSLAGTEDVSTYDFTLRNLELNKSVLSGNIGSTSDSTDNTYHVIYNAGQALDSTTQLDGFEIREGLANEPGVHDDGGGIFLALTSGGVKIFNCRFINNQASDWGGAVYLSGGAGLFRRVQFTYNSAGTDGGGVYLENAGTTSFYSCLFDNNEAEYSGGGFYAKGSAISTFRNSLFAYNKATYGGATLIQSDAKFVNCTFARNTAYEGGAISQEAPSLDLVNSVLWWNQAVQGRQLHLKAATSTTASFSNIANSSDDIHGTGGFTESMNLHVDPMLANPWTGDFRLTEESPVIDLGDDTAMDDSLDIRGAGYPRKLLKTDASQAGVVDMGAFEYKHLSDSAIPCSQPSDGGMIGQDSLVCPGTVPPVFSNVAAASGQLGSSTLIYKWQKSTTGSGQGFVDIPGATLDSLVIDSALTADSTWFRRLARAGCSTDWEDAGVSNVRKITMLDTVPPLAVCKDVTLYLDNTGNATLSAASVDSSSTDNCVIDTMTLSKTSFSCQDISNDMVMAGNSVTLTVTDERGNTATCTASLTVLDTVPPKALCQDVTVSLGTNGSGTTTAVAVDSSSADACGISTLVLNDSTFTCADDGSSITLTVTDSHGNTSTCSATVSITDMTPPTALCHDTTVYLDATGMALLATADIDNGSSDNCGALDTMTLDITSFDCEDLDLSRLTGNTVTLTVTDDSGNTATCTANVTVLDTVPPIAVCKDITVYLDAMGLDTIAAIEVDNNSSDSCGIDGRSLDINSFDCSDIAPAGVATGNTVTLTVTDANGNTSTCTALVTVLDTVPPVAVCKDVTVYLDAAGVGSLDSTEVNNNSSDSCGIASFSLDVASFDCNDLDNNLANGNTVTLTVTDVNGNTATCTADVAVLDTVPPVAVCQDVEVTLDATGNGSATAAAVDNGSSDACGVTLSLSPNTFTTSDIGPNTVTLTVTDGSGNSASCTATATVGDNIPPVANCQNLTLVLNSQGNRITSAEAVNNNSTDPSGIASLSLSQTSFNCSDVGPNTVTLTVTDNYANSSTCSAVITILDNTPPQVLCQPASVALDAQGLGNLAPAAVNNGSTDVCGIGSLSLSKSSFTCANVGMSTVTLTVTDVNGNTATCTAAVTVADNVAPLALCKPATLSLGADGTVTVLAASVDNNSNDACGIINRSLSPASFNCTHVGLNTVTLTVTDVNGNSSACSATVTVQDLLVPNAKCKSAIVYLDASGQAGLAAAQVNNSSNDNCGIASLALSKTSFDCSNLGGNVVTLTVTDLAGNTKTCDATVMVADNLPPTLVCKNITLPVVGATTLQPSQVIDAAASGDNCGAVLTPVGVTPNQFFCINAGPNVVTLTANDGHGNTATCQATVTVQGPLITAVTTPEDCGQLNGTMVITAQNFVGQPGYSVDNGVNYQLINTFSSLEVGIYPVVVTFFGADNCTTPPIYVAVGENILTNTWTGGGDNSSWTDILNWSLTLKPTACHHVVIPGGKSVLLTAGQTGNARTLDVQGGGVLTVEETAVLNVNQQ
ncbi:MAG: hypothetical protein RI973_357 [Bacteroidota bacterium]|jgi:predicted outer membrane repeat protein